MSAVTDAHIAEAVAILSKISVEPLATALAAAEQRGAERAGKAVDALDALMRRLDSHFGGDPAQDWKEQEDARAVLALAKENGRG